MGKGILFAAAFVLSFVIQLSTGSVNQRFSYNFHATTMVSEATNQYPEAKAEIVVDAKIDIDILQETENEKFAKAQVQSVTCNIGSIANSESYYFSFDSDSNTLKSLYSSTKVSKHWNAALAAVSILFGSEQSPVGKCNVEGDSKYRKTTKCLFNPETDHSLLHPFNQSYEQTVHRTENGASSSEKYVFYTVIHGKAKVVVKTDTTLTLRKEEKLTENPCTSAENIKECISVLKLNSLGSFSELKWASVKTKTQNEFGKLVTQFQSFSDPMEHDKLSERDALKFSQLVDLAADASTAEIIAVMREPENDRPMLSDVLAACGTSSSHKAAVEVLALESPELLERYFASLANTKQPSDWLIQDLITQSKRKENSKKMRENIFMTLAALTNRYCTKKGSCHDSGDTVVSKTIALFKKQLNNCRNTENPKQCGKFVLQCLENVQSELVIDILYPILCSTTNKLEAEALRVLKSVPKTELDLEELEGKLLKIYENRCPRKTDPSSRSLAAEILMEFASQKPQILSRILSSFYNASTPVERELFSYVWGYMQRMDAKYPHLQIQKIIKNSYLNYNNVAFGAQSTTYGALMTDLGDSKMAFDVQVEFAAGTFKRSTTDITYSEPHATHPLLTVDIQADGLASCLGSGGVEEPIGDEDQSDASASMQLGFFGLKQPAISLFSGQGELMSAVWNADGRPLTAFEGNFITNDYSLVLPLASGLAINLHTMTSLSVKMIGSIEVSLWYRSAHAVVSTSGSLALDSKLALSYANELLQPPTRLLITGLGNVNVVSDVDFHEEPFKICMRMDNSRLSLTQSFAVPRDGKTFRIRRRKAVEPRSFLTHERISNMCNILLPTLEN